MGKNKQQARRRFRQPSTTSQLVDSLVLSDPFSTVPLSWLVVGWSRSLPASSRVTSFVLISPASEKAVHSLFCATTRIVFQSSRHRCHHCRRTRSPGYHRTRLRHILSGWSCPQHHNAKKRSADALSTCLFAVGFAVALIRRRAKQQHRANDSVYSERQQ